MNVIVLTILIICTAGAAGSALYWYAFRFEPVNFKLSEVDIVICSVKKSNQKIKKSDPFLTILHLSDFHLRKDRKGDRLFHFIQGLKVLRPDLVLITGDLVEREEYFPYLIEMLSGFEAKLGKFTVFGVHDYYDKTIKEFTKNMIKRKKEYRRENDIKGLIEKLCAIGIKVLRNDTVRFNLDSLSDSEVIRAEKDYPGNDSQKEGKIGILQLIGLEDAIIEKTDIDAAFKDLNSGLNKDDNHSTEDSNININAEGNYRNSNIEVNNIAPGRKKDHFRRNRDKIHKLNKNGRISIAITHTPDMDMMVELVERDTDIILCGHTHGGQVRLPGVGALITGSRVKARYASGLFYFRDFVLYTTRGLGEGRYSPFRFFCQPEASLIRIHES